MKIGTDFRLLGQSGQVQEVLLLNELYLYGCSRLGAINADTLVTYKEFDGEFSYVSGTTVETTCVDSTFTFDASYATRILGRKHFEMSNHLGNVLAVVSDRKMPRQVNSQGYYAEVMQTQDYYAYGSEMKGRGTNAVEKYRFGFNTQEKTPELGNSHYTAPFWEYNGALGRRWNVDPVVNPSEGSYTVLGGNPIWYTDVLGNVKNPIYNTQGKFLGTDSKGLQGSPILMDEADFTQNMSHDEAMSKDVGIRGHGWLAAEIEAVQKTLPSRPDWDGFVTIQEGIDWAKSHPNLDNDGIEKNGMGNATALDALYIDASKLDFGILNTNHLTLGKGEQRNLLDYTSMSPASIATTYALGRTIIKLETTDGTVSLPNGTWNIYNWDRGSPSIRRTLIDIERWRAGLDDSHGFPLQIYGQGKVGVPRPPPSIQFKKR